MLHGLIHQWKAEFRAHDPASPSLEEVSTINRYFDDPEQQVG